MKQDLVFSFKQILKSQFCFNTLQLKPKALFKGIYIYMYLVLKKETNIEFIFINALKLYQIVLDVVILKNYETEYLFV